MPIVRASTIGLGSRRFKTAEEMPYPHAKAVRQVPRPIREQPSRRAQLLFGKALATAA
jgi:hypothetical protein